MPSLRFLQFSCTFAAFALLTEASQLRAQTTDNVLLETELAFLTTWEWDSNVLEIGWIDTWGPQLEHAINTHVVPWASVRRNEVYDVCVLELGECVLGGWSALLGANLRTRPYSVFVAYLALSAGLLRWDDGEIDGMWMLRPGLSLVGFNRIRPRAEFGYERYLGTLGFTLGVGVAFQQVWKTVFNELREARPKGSQHAVPASLGVIALSSSVAKEQEQILRIATPHHIPELHWPSGPASEAANEKVRRGATAIRIWRTSRASELRRILSRAARERASSGELSGTAF